MDHPTPAPSAGHARWSLADFILPPLCTPRAPVSRALLWLSGLLITVVLLLALPCIRDRYVLGWAWREHVSDLRARRSTIISWTEWSRISVEVLIALTIAGQVFAADIRSRFEAAIREYQNTRVAILTGVVETQKREIARFRRKFLVLTRGVARWADVVPWLQRLAARCARAAPIIYGRATNSTKRALLRREYEQQIEDTYQSRRLIRWIRRAWTLASRVRSISLSEMPRLQRRLLFLGLCVNFPGGMYGMVTYVLFILLLTLKLAKLYFESPLLAATGQL